METAAVKKYKRQIKAACVEAGTYRPFFDPTITALAQILEKRDQVQEQYETEYDSQPVIEYTNKGGSTNPTKNPALVLWSELTRDALAYRRELGLTPAGLKKIDEQSMKPKKKSSLAEVLKDLG